MKVFNAITELLKFKNYCTYGEIAQITGVKRLKVLEILNKNKRFLKMNKERIVGLTNSEFIITEFANKGKTYTLEKENYGCIEIIVFEGNNELRKELEKPYICGGIGDNYTIQCIENTKENLDKVLAAGLRELKFVKKVEPVEKYWIEED